MRICLVLLLLFGLCIEALAIDLPPFEGLIEPKEQVDFSSSIPGILEEVAVERGDWVKSGQVLARLKSGQAIAAVRLAEARVEYGKRKALRNEELYKRKLISIHDKDELETEIQFAELELVVARERLELRTIRSTIDGVVVERLGAPGEYVGEDPFLTVSQINPLSVELVVPVEYLGAIKEGSVAKVHLEAPINKSFTAKVVIVDPVIDAASGTFGVRLELPNAQMKLSAGLKCQVFFEKKPDPDL